MNRLRFIKTVLVLGGAGSIYMAGIIQGVEYSVISEKKGKKS